MSHDQDLANHRPDAIGPSPGGVSRAGAGRTTAQLPASYPVQRHASAAGARPGALPFLDVQLASDDAAAATGADPAAAAAHGLGAPGQALPFGDQIQAAFGDHDVSGVTAHVGGAAAEASAALGAHGYATGQDVAFAAAPDLHLAAHEAAHVVQQRAGVQLSSAVGQAGDAYEQHADRVADAVVAGASAAPLLDAFAGSGGGGGAAAVQRKEDNWLTAGMTAGMDELTRFQQANDTERVRMLAAERDHKARAAMLKTLAPQEALSLIYGGSDTFEVEGMAALLLLDQLPRVVAAMDAQEASWALIQRPEAPATGRIFAHLTFAVQVKVFPGLLPEVAAAVWPSHGSVELKTALLNITQDHQLTWLVARLGEAEVEAMTDYLPPHVVARVRSACQKAGVHPTIVAAGVAPADEDLDGNARPARNLDTYADELAIEGEAWDAANTKPTRAQRFTTSSVPEPDDWEQLDWAFQVYFFRFAPMYKRVGYLGRSARKYELLTTLTDLQDRAETMAAYVRKYAWAADRLVGDADEADLVTAVRLLTDPTDIAAVFAATLNRPQRLGALLAVMQPGEIAAVFTNAKNNDLRKLWPAVVEHAAPAMVTAVLRRLSDDELARLGQWCNEPDQVAALTPPERRAALGEWAVAPAGDGGT